MRAWERVAVFDNEEGGDVLRGFVCLTPDGGLRVEPGAWPDPEENRWRLEGLVEDMRGTRSARLFMATLPQRLNNGYSRAEGVEDDAEAARLLAEYANGPVPWRELPPDDEVGAALIAAVMAVFALRGSPDSSPSKGRVAVAPAPGKPEAPPKSARPEPQPVPPPAIPPGRPPEDADGWGPPAEPDRPAKPIVRVPEPLPPLKVETLQPTPEQVAKFRERQAGLILRAALERLDNLDEPGAREVLEDLAAKYPETKAGKRAREMLGRK